jgi:hypothetical protein
VDCLLTPTTVQSFRRFKQRHKQIKNSVLVKEALPNATREEEQAIVKILDKLSKDEKITDEDSKGEKITDEDFQELLELIVLAGQRAILTTDLKDVLNDTIAEQFSWNQKLGIPDSADLYDIDYRSVNDRTSTPNGQLQGLQEIDIILDSLLEPKSKFRNSPKIAVELLPDQAQDGCQNYIKENFLPILKDKGKDGVEKTLEEQFAKAFPNSGKNTHEDLSSRLFWLLDQLNNEGSPARPAQIKRFNDTSKAFTIKFIFALTPFLEKLLEMGEKEANALATLGTKALPETIDGIKAFNNQLKDVIARLKKAENNLKPNFSPTDGYLDKPLIPYVTGSLVDSSIQNIMNNPQKMENYFRYQYRVGSEKVKQNIPPVILNKLLARSGLVIGDILRSEPTGEVLSKNPIFKVVDSLLRTLYFWVEAKDPATSFVPKVLLPLLSWIIVFAPLFVIAFLVSQIPRLLLGVIITLLIAQLVYSTYGKKGSRKLAFKAFSFLIVLMILSHEFVGLPLPHKGTIRLKRLFNDYCPRIQTPLTAKDCKS